MKQFNKIFFDSDAHIDIGMERTSFYIDSAKAIQKITEFENILMTSSLIISNIHYILSKRGQSKES